MSYVPKRDASDDTMPVSIAEAVPFEIPDETTRNDNTIRMEVPEASVDEELEDLATCRVVVPRSASGEIDGPDPIEYEATHGLVMLDALARDEVMEVLGRLAFEALGGGPNGTQPPLRSIPCRKNGGEVIDTVQVMVQRIVPFSVWLNEQGSRDFVDVRAALRPELRAPALRVLRQFAHAVDIYPLTDEAVLGVVFLEVPPA